MYIKYLSIDNRENNRTECPQNNIYHTRKLLRVRILNSELIIYFIDMFHNSCLFNNLPFLKCHINLDVTFSIDRRFSLVLFIILKLTIEKIVLINNLIAVNNKSS